MEKIGAGIDITIGLVLLVSVLILVSRKLDLNTETPETLYKAALPLAVLLHGFMIAYAVRSYSHAT